MVRRRKRRREIAELLKALLKKEAPDGHRLYVAWDDSNTHEDDEVEGVVRAAAGRLVLLYLPTSYSPWLNPIEILWRHLRREVSHCEPFPSIEGLVAAAYDSFERHNRRPGEVLSIIGSNAAGIN